jgi:hypothetical protein
MAREGLFPQPHAWLAAIREFNARAFERLPNRLKHRRWQPPSSDFKLSDRILGQV